MFALASFKQGFVGKETFQTSKPIGVAPIMLNLSCLLTADSIIHVLKWLALYNVCCNLVFIALSGL